MKLRKDKEAASAAGANIRNALLEVGLSLLPGVRLVTWTILAVIN